MAAPRSLACPLAGGCTISAGRAAHFGVPAALGGSIHTGLDLRAAIGTPVLAPAPGVLRRRWFGSGTGTNVELQHDGFTTRYRHLSGVLLPVGSPVALGQAFAKSGASGTLVTGPHLHFEVLADGVYEDPEPLLFGGQSSANVEPPLWDGIAAYPLPPGKSCAPGYRTGTMNPGPLGALPFTIWWNRPTNPDGTVNACIGPGLSVGENAAINLAEIPGAAADAIGGAFLSVLIPVAVNVGVVVLVVVLAFSGARQALAASAA